MSALGGVSSGGGGSAGGAPSAIALGIGLGSFLRAATSAEAPFELPLTLTTIAGLEAPLAYGLTPTSIVQSGGIVSAWNDVGPGARHHTATGSPAYNTSGPVPGVELDGVNDRLDWTGSGFDDTPCSIFILHKVNAYPSLGAYSGILELSSTSGSDDSHWLYAYGSSQTIGLRTGDNKGATSYTSGGTDLMVTRIDVVDLVRGLRKNGKPKGSNAFQRTTKTITRSRMGQRVAADVSYHPGLICAVAVYTGELNDASKILVENGFLQWGGLTRPFDYGDMPTASLTGDPEILLPATMPVYAGVPLRIDHYGARNRTGKAALTVTSPDSLFPVDTSPDGRTIVLTSGGCTIDVAEGDYTTSTIVTGYDFASQPKKYVLAFGDSNIHRMQLGLFEMLYGILGSAGIQFVGTVSPADANYLNGKAEGRDSWAFSAAAVTAGAAGGFNASGSPFWVGGGSLNMAAYEALLAHAPTHVFVNCLQNGPYLVSEAALPAMLAAEKTAAKAIFAAMHAQWPNIPIALANGWALHADPTLWSNQAGRDAMHRKMHAAALCAAEIVSESQALGINATLCSTKAHVGPGTRPDDPWEADGIHLSPYGHRQLVPTVLGWLFNN